MSGMNRPRIPTDKAPRCAVCGVTLGRWHRFSSCAAALITLERVIPLPLVELK